MRVRLPATGTCGDVQPYVALGLGLKRAGFEVALAATANSRPFVESYGVSPSVLPKARDWGGHVHLTGYWLFLPDDQNHFLNAGDPPVFVSFGSMASKDARARAATVPEAVKEAGVRAILASGWSGLSASEVPPAHLRFLREYRRCHSGRYCSVPFTKILRALKQTNPGGRGCARRQFMER